MRPFTYEALAGRVVFGNGAFARIPEELDRLGAARVLLIADRSGKDWADRLATRLGDRLAARIDEVRVHVPVELAEDARRIAAGAGADSIVTIGGGSATGLAKAVALGLPIPILAVPTTYAGSEMTPIWGLTSGAHKETGRDPRVQPRTVVYDPVLSVSLPAPVSAASGLNALAHCVEALYADGANPVTTVMAEEGIRILARSLPTVVASPGDLDARGEVLVGAYLAGASFASAGAGIHHKICHVLGGAYDLPHAETHAVILPHALAFVAPAVPEAMARLTPILGADAAGAIQDLARAMAVPTSLSAIGMEERDLDEAARLVTAAAPDHPRHATERDMRALLGAAFRGDRAALPAPSAAT